MLKEAPTSPCEISPPAIQRTCATYQVAQCTPTPFSLLSSGSPGTAVPPASAAYLLVRRQLALGLSCVRTRPTLRFWLSPDSAVARSSGFHVESGFVSGHTAITKHCNTSSAGTEASGVLPSKLTTCVFGHIFIYELSIKSVFPLCEVPRAFRSAYCIDSSCLCSQFI
jgi:hypothetical protein